MGSSKKNRRKNPADDGGVDLLSLAFNLPTRRDMERADREAAQAQAHSQSIRIQYDPGDGESSDSESLPTLNSDPGKPNTEVEETPKVQKALKPRSQHQLKAQNRVFQLSSPKYKPKRVDNEPPPARRASKRDSSKARERSSSSPAALRAPSPASSIPSSATFPRITSNYPQKAAHLATSDIPVRPLQSGKGREAHPQQFYQPIFAFPAASVYPPSQYYSAVANADLVSDVNQHVPFPLYTLAPASILKSHQPSSISQEVQRIQSKLDEVVVNLSKRPEDATLKSELSVLQTELNTRLNSLLGMAPSKEPNVSEVSELFNSKATSKNPTTQSQPTAVQREMSPKRKMRHHLCTGCGKVRSSNYHTKHPIISGDRPSTNYCEDCFEENVEDGALDNHFCYGCGNVRSKEFQQNHPISKGDRPFPNYCSVCVKEIRSAETIADVSMVDFTPGRSHKSSSYTDSALNYTRNTHTDGSNAVDAREQKKIPQPLKLSTNGPQFSPSNSSPGSPYYPVRNTGASQRRAERSPLASPGGQYCSSPDTPTTPRYQPPYVEDIFSPLQETSRRSADYQNSSRNSPCDDRKNSFYRTTAGDKEKSQDDPVGRSAKAPHSDIFQEGSDDSTEGHASTDDSTHSTGSKSVKFRPKVNIRLSDSQSSSNASSHAKILEEDIKPDEETIPSRVGIYGTSPKKSHNGYYTRAKESQNFASLAGEDGCGETIPERGYRGAFSKDSPASSWLPPLSNASGGHWYSRPFSYQSTTSPSMESYTGFKPGGKSTFNYGSSGGVGSETSRPPLRATRSAFNSANTSPEAAFSGDGADQESQRPPLSSNSNTQAEGCPESPSNRWKSFTSPYAGPSTQSSFRKGSPWNNFPSRFDSDCYTMQDGSTFSQTAFSDYSQPSSNPYYEPRKRPFPDLNDYCSFGTRAPRIPGKWAKDYQRTVKPPKQMPYWIPEPIIEEPDSPISSPGKRANMLEFDDIDISPASASNTATVLFPDLGSFAEHDHQSDDDSDKENTVSKSSRDTPSLD
ncbi:hypothetical protein M441DRAFT_75442 [Trichoderma asperellum CBS 433.97]|uniref:Uncharacterized protein n=1 Tax=Trichoderma asperellum (strain ATCC 204424 / CBS 433.97 / NBRC 101777) TaxID=1042311 RepID=A0A2T3ZP68_TRIA4|nr:hypothetical protein M441DRAFT_75442 [Trichoderma asperellum CBS 433.97]PTB46610.1 hypothetical protein M441DRAFT_75442 [Trichoderma asperellum CBS 433.97]